jgi:hypothetical protein
MLRRSAAAIWVLCLASSAGAQPREFATPWGRGAVLVPDPVAAGTWDGSWVYANRDQRMALYIRTVDGRPEVKFQYQSLAGPEAFESDWTGKATYYLSGSPVEFELAIVDADAAEMRGTWNWHVEFSDSGRSERGTFRLYRINDGRDLAVVFQEYERVIRRFDRVSRWDNPPVWVFNKASKRIVLWDELPF